MPSTVQTPVVELVTELAPSPVVDMIGMKLPPKVPDPGKLEIDGVDGVAWPIEKLWSVPSADE